MTKLIDMLYIGFEYNVKFVRVPAFTTAAVTRGKSAHFCRYSCISDNIIK